MIEKVSPKLKTRKVIKKPKNPRKTRKPQKTKYKF